MRPGPKVLKQWRLSESYGHSVAWARTGAVLIDPKATYTPRGRIYLPLSAGAYQADRHRCWCRCALRIRIRKGNK
jgi:hypothetical protein